MSIEKELTDIDQLLRFVVTNVEQEGLKMGGIGGIQRLDVINYPAFIDDMTKLQEHAERAAKSLKLVAARIGAENNRGREYVKSRGYGYNATLRDFSKRSSELTERCYNASARIQELILKRFDPGQDLGEAITEPFRKANAVARDNAPSNMTTGTVFTPSSSSSPIRMSDVSPIDAANFLATSLYMLVRCVKLWIDNKKAKQQASTPKRV